MLVHNKNIDILVKPGINLLGFDCAIGKTYLYKLLKAASITDKNILSLSYTDSENIINKVRNFKGNLLMLDRVDLYYSTELLEALRNLHDCTILLDLKNTSLCNSFVKNLATIELHKTGIEVKPLAINIRR